MSGENIFALQLSTPNPSAVIPNNGLQWDSGYRSILAVRMVWAKVQTTVLFGDSLYLIWYNTGTLDPQTAFSFFVNSYRNRPMPAAQLPYPPYAATPAVYNRYPNIPVPPPPIPTSTGTVTILNSGFDPFRGYWVEFAGNYFLTFPLFKDWPNVIRDGPNYKGFQPSANNPGSGGSGSSSGGSGSGTPPQTC
jgi:hypothetical protein